MRVVPLSFFFEPEICLIKNHIMVMLVKLNSSGCLDVSAVMK